MILVSFETDKEYEIMITAQQVNELRKISGAGMMDCKKALTEADGDIDKAIELLRKKGAAVAGKRADREAKEGIISVKVSEDSRTASMCVLNCETDFVARSVDFTAFAGNLIEKVFDLKAASPEDLMEKDASISGALTDLIGKVGEKCEISKTATIETSTGMVIAYLHHGAKLGVLMEFENVGEELIEAVKIVAKDCAMQAAAMRPLCVYREEVPTEIIEKEIEIYKEILRKEGKPEAMLDKISIGKLNKYYMENCLFEQVFVKDESLHVSGYIEKFNKENNAQVKIKGFLRYHLGESN